MGRTRHIVVALVAILLGTMPTGPAALWAQSGANARTRIEGISCTAATANASARVAPAPRLAWRGATAMRWAAWPVALGARGVRARLIVVDIDPARVTLSLEIARNGGEMVPWSLDDAPSDALIAFNAGQFTDDGPWGLVVHRGREWQPAGRGPLAGAVVVDSTGRVVITGQTDLDATRSAGGAQEALQSYPMLLERGAPPSVLCDMAADLDRTHRDIRFAIGVRADGHVLLALSRYEGVGAIIERIPIGPTTPEMAEVMRRLGARDALMLDGGLSAQLLLRDGDNVRRWEGLRRVPLAIVGRRRAH